MELRSGFPLLIQQYRALLKKNLLLSWRNKRATFLQLFSSLFFIFLIFCIQKAVETRFASSSTFVDLRNPPLKIGPPIPPCEDKYFIKLPCYDFVYSGNSSPNVRRIVASIMANNPGRPIPQQKVRAFDTRGEVDEWLHRNNMVCPGALHFSEINNNNRVISYGVQTNSTAVIKRGNYEDPTFKFQIPLQIAAEREIARFFLGVPNFSWVVNFMEFAHPIVASYSAVDTVGPAFFLAIAMFGFVLQISSLITEKELKLRQAMTMMGLFDTAYWLSWLTWEGLMTLISSLFTVLFGMMFRFDFFTLNDFRIVFLVFFLFQLNMVGFAFMLSAFISKSSSSTTVGFSIFIVGFLTQMVTGLGFPYSGDYSKSLKLFWSLFPPNLLAKALSLLSDATSTSGIRWSGRKKCAGDATECAMTINDVYLWLVGTFLLWFFLAIYLDNIIPNAAGVRKSVFYFLRPGYWTGKGGGKVKEGSIFSFKGSLPALERITPDDEDVLEEENKVKQQTSERKMDPNVSVQIRGLVKTYPGILKASLCCCCKRKETPPYHAVKGLWVNFAKDQLFCLLGPNGAGKTTSISCLTGITPVTGGDALIYGHSVCDSVGMSNIRKIIGVCPQFDILWDVLSGLEHLYLFAMIKGLLPSSIKPIAEKSLAEVKLTPAAKMRSGSYSGGMKRRLSVAIALIGDPKLVILDEPTTGMDPITRRRVWDIIEGAKRGRAILLTTHSMEEADILSDRIGIMAKGRLRCIGTSIRLKSRFGAGFVANVSFASTATTNHEAIKQFFKSRLDILPKEEHKSFLTYIIPHDREKLLTKFFDELEERKGELGISDVQLSLTTLEEVFMNIAKQAELENAVADGSMVTLTLTTSGNSVQIPIGAKFVGIAGTENSVNPRGMMVEVYWEQDDTGALCISGHSQEIPVPPNVQALASLRPKTSQFGEVGPVYGIVYDSKQVAG